MNKNQYRQIAKQKALKAAINKIEELNQFFDGDKVLVATEYDLASGREVRNGTIIAILSNGIDTYATNFSNSVEEVKDIKDCVTASLAGDMLFESNGRQILDDHSFVYFDKERSTYIRRVHRPMTLNELSDHYLNLKYADAIGIVTNTSNDPTQT